MKLIKYSVDEDNRGYYINVWDDAGTMWVTGRLDRQQYDRTIKKVKSDNPELLELSGHNDPM